MALSKKMVSLLLVCLTPCIFFAQQTKKNSSDDHYRIFHWNAKDGLPSDIHNVMIKDERGFLWIGSAEGELSRFDGTRFKKYIPGPDKRGAINSGSIFALKEDSLRNIWIGTAIGLSRYDTKTDTFTNFMTAIDSVKTNKSVIPFWSTDKQVYCLESGTMIIAYDIYSLKKKTILTLTEDDHIQTNFPAIDYAIVDTFLNCLWMLEGKSRQNGVGGLLQISLSNGKRESYIWPCYKKDSSHRHYAEAMILDRKRNSIWINSGDGLMEFSLQDKKFQQTKALNEFVKLKDYRDFVGIDIDASGRILLATYPKGIFIYDPKTEQVQPLFSDPELQMEIGYANLHIYCDRDGIIWTSYWRPRGIYQLLPFRPFVKRYSSNPKKKDSLSNSFIQTIVPAADGKIWIGTDDGLNILDPVIDKFEVLREQDLPGIRGNAIKPLQVDIIHQKAWLNVGDMRQVYETVLYEMDIKTRQCRPIVFRNGSEQLDSIRINSYLTHPYKNGLLVFAANYGLFEIKNGSLFADLVIPLKKNFSRIALNENHFLFLRNFDRYGSLPPNFTFENINGKWIKIPHPLDSLEWKFILYNKKDQTHWVALRYELIHYAKDFRIIKTYNLTDWYNGSIINMQIDNGGNLWLINDLQQLVRLNIATGIFTSMSETDGYQKQYFDWVSPGAIDKTGNLYFGGRDLIKGHGGLDRISPERYSSDITSSVYFNSLSINKRPFPLTIGINILEHLPLRYNQNSVSIETGIIDYYSMGKSYIRYKLEGTGKNEDWQYAPAYNTIRYEGLPTGSYRLIIQSSNSGNEFNSPQKPLNFTISPAFWNTWWFRMSSVICFVALFYGLIRWRLQQKFHLQFERTEKEKELSDMRQKTSELEMQALRSQMNPHFIFNSLNAINRFILQNNKTQASEYLTKFSRLVRLILQNSQSPLISLEKELEALQLYLELEVLRFDNHFEFKVRVNDDLDISSLKVPPLIIQPFAENAIWHGLMPKEDKGHLKIDLFQQEGVLCCRLTDDGIGRKKAAELKSKSASTHKSMGMQITASRIEILQQKKQLNGNIQITDLLLPDGTEGGTDVLLKIPVSYD